MFKQLIIVFDYCKFLLLHIEMLMNHDKKDYNRQNNDKQFIFRNVSL